MIEGAGDCPEPAYAVLRPYATAAEWLNCDALSLIDRGDTELVEAACVSAMAEHDYQEYRREQERQKASIRK